VYIILNGTEDQKNPIEEVKRLPESEKIDLKEVRVQLIRKSHIKMRAK